MAKKERAVNPAEAHRKAQRKREVKKNKEERKKTRDEALLKRDPRSVAAEIEKYQFLDENGQLDAIGKSKLARLIAGKSKIEEFKKNNKPPKISGPTVPDVEVKIPKDPRRSFYYHPTLNPLGVPPPGMPYREIDMPLESIEINENQEEKEKSEQNEDDKDFDSDVTSDEDSQEEEIDKNIIIQTQKNDKDGVNNEKLKSNKIESKTIDEEIVPKSLGEVPPFAINKIPNIDYLPLLPKGPPPSYAKIREPFKLKIIKSNNISKETEKVDSNDKKAEPIDSKKDQKKTEAPKKPVSKAIRIPPSLPFPIHGSGPVGYNGYYGPIGHPIHSFHQNNIPSRNPPPAPNSSFYQPPQFYNRGQTNSGQSNTNVTNPQNNSINNNNNKRELKEIPNNKLNQSEEGSEQPPAPIVISAEPKLRDLQKELTTFVPLTLRKKMKVEPKENITEKEQINNLTKQEISFTLPNITTKPNPVHSQGIKLFKPSINAAPNLDGPSVKSVKPVPLIKPMAFKPPPVKSFLAPPPPKTVAKEQPEVVSVEKANEEKKDDYAKFMDEIEDLL